MEMALLRTNDIRAMRPEDRDLKLKELNDELMHERGVAAMGGAPASPGKLRAIRTNIARILTIQREIERGEKKPAKSPERKMEKKTATAKRSRPEAEPEEADDQESEN